MKDEKKITTPKSEKKTALADEALENVTGGIKLRPPHEDRQDVAVYEDIIGYYNK